VSVGHVARELEKAGIATTAIYIGAFEHYARAMKVPRVLITRHAMGRPVGPPGDAQRQREVVATALGLIETATEGGTILPMPGSYRPSLGS
jgi:hypothetical protein